MIKETLLVSTFGLLGLVTVACGSQKKDQTAEAVSETAWCLDGFERPTGVNPVIKPLPTKFYCPMREDSVAWEESDTFNPAATIYDGKIVVMYRAEDNSAQGIGSRTSRLGYATSTDGIHFERDTKPAFYPAKDNQVENECPGGTEDPRIAMTEDGTYVLLYTQWNRKVPRLAVATSKDLKHWTKFGPAFEKAYNGKFKDEATKSASLVTTLKGDKQVIAKVNGKYFMYWGEKNVYAATSDNLTDWDPLLDENGELLKLFSPRSGYFDSQLTECGPPAILTKDGIVLLYNGKNKQREKGDTSPGSDPAPFAEFLPVYLLSEYSRNGKPWYPFSPLPQEMPVPHCPVFSIGSVFFLSKLRPPLRPRPLRPLIFPSVTASALH